jgi:hypothetical protein
MSRKDFNGLAAALAPYCPTFDDDARRVWLEMVNDIADVCQRANANFDRDRFRLACQGA